MEYLEIPWQIAIFMFVGFALVILPLLFTLSSRKVEHLYVSVWYIVAALLWIALLFLVGKMPGVHTGVQQATTNWWYGHNVLGLWFTPVSVGAIYYFRRTCRIENHRSPNSSQCLNFKHSVGAWKNCER